MVQRGLDAILEFVVENAVVHAEQEPRLHISIEKETLEEERGTSEWTTLTVADDGPGIPEAFDGKLVIDRAPASEFTTAVSLRLQPGASGYAIE